MRRVRRKRFKRALYLILAIGIVAFSGTGGTLASFNAETVNSGTSIASGTLTLSNQVDSGTVCLSSSTTDNVNNKCDAVLNLTNLEPGTANPVSQVATVTVDNTGSLNASTLKLGAPSATDCVDTATKSAPGSISIASVSLTSGSLTATASSFSGVTPGMLMTASGALAAGTTVVSVGSGTLVMSQAAAATATTTVVFGGTYGKELKFSSTHTTVAGVSTTSGSASLGLATGFPTSVIAGESASGTNIPAGAIVTGENLSGTAVTISAAATGTGTSGVTFSNPFCASVVMWVQESAVVQGQTDYYCWYGPNAALGGASEAATDGLCEEPSAALSTPINLNDSIASIPVNNLSFPISAGDTLELTNASGQSQYLTAQNSVGITTGATSIAVSPSASAAYAYPAGTTAVIDLSNSINSSSQTISNFDSTDSAGITLYPISGPGTVDTTGSVQLAAQTSRTFSIGLYLPNPNTVVSNYLQGLDSTFGLTWYLNQ